MPYKDIFDHKGPFLYVLNSLGHILSPACGIWFVELIFLLFTVFFAYKTARLYCNTALSCLVVTQFIATLAGYFVTGNTTEEYALPFIMFAVYVFIDYFQNGNISKLRLIGFGFGFGAICMLRPNMISVWVVFCLAVFISCLIKKSYKELLSFALLFLLGTSCIILPLLLWLLSEHALKAFWDCYFIFNFNYASAPFAGRVIVLFTFLLQYMLLICLSIVVYFIIQKKSTAFHWIYLAAMLFSLLMLSMSGFVFRHYFMVMLPLFVYPCAALLAHLHKKHPSQKLMIYSCTIIFIICSTATLSLVPNGPFYLTSEYTKNTSDPMLREMIDCVKDNTEPTDEILICANYCAVYRFSERRPSTIKYMFIPPLDRVPQEMKDDYIRELSRNKPRLILLETFYSFPQLETFLKENHYEKISTIERPSPLRPIIVDIYTAP